MPAGLPGAKDWTGSATAGMANTETNNQTVSHVFRMSLPTLARAKMKIKSRSWSLCTGTDRRYRRAPLSAVVLILLNGSPVQAGTQSLGQDVAVALPIIAGGITFAKEDWIGGAELTVDTATTVGIAYGLKHVIHEQRPDKSDFHSMPSDTAALAFGPAQYLWDRYGWEYGVPAYAAATFVAWSRVDAKKHHWYDVAASAGLAFGASKLFTTRYHDQQLSYGVSMMDNGAFGSLSYRY
jgi:membrane-associated phospholipid phosphatase